MTRHRKSDGRYELLLHFRRYSSSSVVASLRRTHEVRTERIRPIDEQFPYWFDGVDEVMAGLQSIRSKTACNELKTLLGRVEDEVLRSIEAILRDAEQTLNDSSRVLMEIEVLLMEWALDPSRIERRGKATEHERHSTYGFGKVLQRVKQKLKVDDGLDMPERKEYDIHSQALHPSPGTADRLLDTFEHQTSEVVAHVGRIFRRTLDAVRTSGSPEEIAEEEILFPGEAWERLYRVFIIQRDYYLAAMLASRGMRMMPRQPHPKGTQRVVLVDSGYSKGASFFKQITETS